jgi:LysM repeat protein
MIPAYAQAGFFSHLARLFLPESATAIQPNPPVATVSLPLLGSHPVAMPIGRQAQQFDSADNDTENDQDPTPLSVVQDSALVGSLNPLGTMSENGQDKIAVYVVQSGDTARGIANKFGISFNTLLWANDLKSSADIKAGDSLIILPVSGVQYEVRKGRRRFV